MYEVAGGRVVSNYLAKVRVSGSNPVVRSKKRRVRRNGAPAAPSRRLGASSFDHRGALTASRWANSTAFRASAAASGAGSHWAGVLNRSSWDSWRAAYRPSSAAVASRLRASTCSPATRWPTRAAVMASHALIRRSLRYRQRHPIGRRRGFRLPRRATPPTWASRPGRHLGRRGDGGYAVESSCTADKVVELRTDEHDGVAANCAPEFASLLGFRSRFAAQVLEAVVEQLDRIASESLGLFGKAGKRGCPFVRVGCWRAYGQHIEVAVGVGFALRKRSEDQRRLGDRLDLVGERAKPSDHLRAEVGKAIDEFPGGTVSRQGHQDCAADLAAFDDS